MANIQHITPDPTSLSTSSDLSLTTSLKIPLLVKDGSNWVLYKAQFLTAKGLRRYLEGREHMPTPTSAPGVDSDADERYETALDKWTANHATIKMLLFQMLPESLKLEVLTLTRAVDMWRIVTSCYDNQGNFVQVNILAQIQRLKCNEGADPQPVLAQLAKLRSEYVTAGGTLSDEQYKVHILALLPLSYRPAVRAILTSAQATGMSITMTALLTAINDIARDEHALEGEQSRGGKEGQGPKRRTWKKKSDEKGKGKEERRENESAKAAAMSVSATLADATFWDGSACLVATDFAKVSASPLKPTPHTHLVDSDASRHFDPHRRNFTILRPITPIPINSADGRVFYATGEGDVRITVHHGRHNINFMLRNILYAPEMPIALTSVSQLVKSGFQVHFERDGCHITTPAGTSLPVITNRSGLYPLSGVQPSSEARAAEATAAAMLQLEFHRRMGHTYPPTLRKMVSKGVVTGVKLDAAEVDFCEVCVQAKQTRAPFPKERSSPCAEAYGDRIHTDMWGKAQVRTWDGKEYFITFLDDHADEAFVSLMRTKSEALSRCRAYEAWVKSHCGVQEIKTIQSDHGGEYTSHEFVEHLEKHGTTRRLTLPKFLWGEAVLHTCWLRNRTSGKNTPGTTPHEVATGEKPDLSHLPRFGAKCWILQQNVGKLDPKSKPGRWIGYSLESKGHKIYWPECRTVSIERDVRFEPDADPTAEVLIDMCVHSEGELTSGSVLNTPDSPSTSSSSSSSSLSPPSTPKLETPKTTAITPPSVSSLKAPQEQTSLKPIVAEQDAPKEPAEPITESRPKCERKPSAWVRNLQAGIGTTGGQGAQRVPLSILGEDAQLAAEFWEEMENEGELEDGTTQDTTPFDSPLFALAALGSDDEPTYHEAMAGSDKERWTAAMREELTWIEQLGTYELVE
ncbi:Retrovirus-related Pol polyprotein from transposon TNT 1-94 [Trametes pubescens]|uniref:Retrovirus-related Pol polyprotein from transposon TNT 1-94 n=1 Tax=Trametes pubescens TaxID=154538 RepID=A0A1M2VGH5_TRAPU|nr:Retrovirus-related Pol polyprotein from transposon TNT 1-94 [Trametes pubescens]